MNAGDSKATASCVKDIPCTLVIFHVFDAFFFPHQGCGAPGLPAWLLEEAPYQQEDASFRASNSQWHKQHLISVIILADINTYSCALL